MNPPKDRMDKYRSVTNLKKVFGHRFVVRDDGTNDSDRIERIWCHEIPGRYGVIYPLGFDGALGVWTASARIAHELTSLGLQLIQGGNEWSFRFVVSRIDEVVGVIRARKRRQLTPEQRAKLIDRLKGHQIKVPSADSKVVSVPEKTTSRL